MRQQNGVLLPPGPCGRSPVRLAAQRPLAGIVSAWNSSEATVSMSAPTNSLTGMTMPFTWGWTWVATLLAGSTSEHDLVPDRPVVRVSSHA